MAEKAVRKTTKKKAVKKVATKKVATKSVPAKKKAPVATRKKAVTKTVIRKAPTPVADKQAEQRSANIIIVTGVVVFLIILGGSAIIGFTEDGQINIDATLSELKEKASQEERDKINSVAGQNKQGSRNALVPSGVPVEVPEVEPVATTTASSTASTASSTDETASSTQEITDSTEENIDQTTQEATSSNEVVDQEDSSTEI